MSDYAPTTEGVTTPPAERLTEDEVREFAATIACLQAGRMDGKQAVATLTALANRFLAARSAESTCIYPQCLKGEGCTEACISETSTQTKEWISDRSYIVPDYRNPGRVHNHPPYRPVCNERRLANGQLRGACLLDDGVTPAPPAESECCASGCCEVCAPSVSGWIKW